MKNAIIYITIFGGGYILGGVLSTYVVGNYFRERLCKSDLCSRI